MLKLLFILILEVIVVVWNILRLYEHMVTKFQGCARFVFEFQSAQVS